MTATVLLVDDSGLARRGTRRVLETAGYSVIEAEDGLSAWSDTRSIDPTSSCWTW